MRANPATPESNAIGITMGDPSGIGPELVAAVISSTAHGTDTVRPDRLVVYGERARLEAAAELLGLNLPKAVAVLDCGVTRDVEIGAPSSASGAASLDYLQAAVEAARRGQIGALVTAPIHKATARAAGLAVAGHTELLAEGLGAKRVAMMFVGPRLKVALATIHVPLAEVGRALTRESVENAIELAVESMRSDFGHERVRVGVLGLNPHAGESGILGREEIETIAPAMAACAARFAAAGARVELVGPLVPDAAFRLEFDVFVAMYHDQALIPVKLLDFDDAVNVTLGLPIVRTSPDHGTAHDIAGRGVARANSMHAALALAAKMLAARRVSSRRSP